MKPMTSQQFSLPSGALSGEVQAQDELGVWRVVLTPTGIPVKDRRQQWDDHGEDAFKYTTQYLFNGADISDYVITRMSDGNITWK